VTNAIVKGFIGGIKGSLRSCKSFNDLGWATLELPSDANVSMRPAAGM